MEHVRAHGTAEETQRMKTEHTGQGVEKERETGAIAKRRFGGPSAQYATPRPSNAECAKTSMESLGETKIGTTGTLKNITSIRAASRKTSRIGLF